MQFLFKEGFFDWVDTGGDYSEYDDWEVKPGAPEWVKDELEAYQQAMENLSPSLEIPDSMLDELAEVDRFEKDHEGDIDALRSNPWGLPLHFFKSARKIMKFGDMPEELEEICRYEEEHEGDIDALRNNPWGCSPDFFQIARRRLIAFRKNGTWI